MIETFPGAFDKQGDGQLNHGRLYVFRRHLAFRSQLPFGISTSAVIPLKVRCAQLWCRCRRQCFYAGMSSGTAIVRAFASRRCTHSAVVCMRAFVMASRRVLTQQHTAKL